MLVKNVHLKANNYYKMVLRGFAEEVITSEGILVHDFKNKLVLATTSWILHPEGKFFIPGRIPAVSYTYYNSMLSLMSFMPNLASNAIMNSHLY